MEADPHLVAPSETREYLIKNGIPQLFECLMTGLMFHRPTDHVNYLQECLEKVKRLGVSSVRWDIFLENCVTPSSKEVAKRERKNKYDPLPGPDSLKVRTRKNTAFVFVLGGPGIDKTIYSQELINQYPTFVHLCMGDLLRNRAKIESQRKGSKWAGSVEQINSGELLPQEMVLESLIWSINQHVDASGFIIDGFPRTQQQYEELKNQIGLESLACVFLLDATEEHCKEQLQKKGQMDEFWMDHKAGAIERRLCLFKLQTLPMCKCIDIDGKLRVVDGEIKQEHIARDMRTVCEYVLSGKVTGPNTKPTPGSVSDLTMTDIVHGMTGCPGQPPVFNIPRIVPAFPDNGRISDLPLCPVILLFGGPGSGRTEQAQALCEKLPGLIHFNLTDFLRNRVLDRIGVDSQKDWDVIARRVHSSDPPMSKDRIIPEYWDVQVDILRQEFKAVADNARAVVVEGFPNDENQLSTFNQHIGGVDLAILLDCEENTLQKRLLKRYTRLSRLEDEEIVSLHRILFFKHCTLPVIRHYDELSVLVTIPGDRDQPHVLNDLVTVVEYFLGKQDSKGCNNNACTTIAQPSLTEHDKENHKPHQLNADHSTQIPDVSNITMVCITGDTKSGKTTLGQKVAEYFDYTYCSYSDFRDRQLSTGMLIQSGLADLVRPSNGLVLDDFPAATFRGSTSCEEHHPTTIVLEFCKNKGHSHASEYGVGTDQVLSSGTLQPPESPNATSQTSLHTDLTTVHKIDASREMDSILKEIINILESYSSIPSKAKLH